ncbi:MAG: hypothetical protein HRU17_20635, partial [Polyangiaceae bacterium]|nr:hypothetical protein [Polyangiaceae bacterium]
MLNHEQVNGLIWNHRLMMTDGSMNSGGEKGFPLPIAHYLAGRYGYADGRGDEIREQLQQTVTALSAQLLEGRVAGGPYYFGGELTALDVCSSAVIGAQVPLPEEWCPMHTKTRSAFEAQKSEALALLSLSLALLSLS